MKREEYYRIMEIVMTNIQGSNYLRFSGIYGIVRNDFTRIFLIFMNKDFNLVTFNCCNN
jgi:hypothetical protein